MNMYIYKYNFRENPHIFVLQLHFYFTDMYIVDKVDFEIEITIVRYMREEG